MPGMGNKCDAFMMHSQRRRAIAAHTKVYTDILLDVIQKLSLAKDLETIMFIVRKAARQLVGSDGATFVLRDNGQCYYADEDAIAPLWKGKRFSISSCISGWAMEHCVPVVIDNIYADSRVLIDAYRPTFVKSLAIVPIRTTSPIGAIGTYWAESYLPTEEQICLLQALADSTSIAMENVLLHSRLEQGHKETSAQMEMTQQLIEANQNLEHLLNELNQRNQEMLWLKEFSSLLQTCFYINEAYQLIEQYTKKLLPTMSGVLYLMHFSRNYLEIVASWGEAVAEKIMKPEECYALRRGSIYTLEYPQKGLICGHKLESNRKSYTCIPLYAQNDIIGLFYLEWDEHAGYRTTDSKNNSNLLMSMLAEQVALGVSNIKLRETLRKQCVRDVLTDLYNRRYLEETLDREINRCLRKSASLALLMIDIDHFKQFNDEFGHEAGDVVIQEFANALRLGVKKGDIVCRYGGEEFILVVPEAELDTILKQAHSLHDMVTHLYLRYRGVALPSITVSIGLAMCPLHGKTMSELITSADKALYEAKHSGRNKTVVYTLTTNNKAF